MTHTCVRARKHIHTVHAHERTPTLWSYFPKELVAKAVAFKLVSQVYGCGQGKTNCEAMTREQGPAHVEEEGKGNVRRQPHGGGLAKLRLETRPEAWLVAHPQGQGLKGVWAGKC